MVLDQEQVQVLVRRPRCVRCPARVRAVVQTMADNLHGPRTRHLVDQQATVAVLLVLVLVLVLVLDG